MYNWHPITVELVVAYHDYKVRPSTIQEMDYEKDEEFHEIVIFISKMLYSGIKSPKIELSHVFEKGKIAAHLLIKEGESTFRLICWQDNAVRFFAETPDFRQNYINTNILNDHNVI